jgi:hypothetical protein
MFETKTEELLRPETCMHVTRARARARAVHHGRTAHSSLQWRSTEKRRILNSCGWSVMYDRMLLRTARATHPGKSPAAFQPLIH